MNAWPISPHGGRFASLLYYAPSFPRLPLCTTRVHFEPNTIWPVLITTYKHTHTHTLEDSLKNSKTIDFNTLFPMLGEAIVSTRYQLTWRRRLIAEFAKSHQKTWNPVSQSNVAKYVDTIRLSTFSTRLVWLTPAFRLLIAHRCCRS